MNTEPRLRFTRIRDVRVPERAYNSAGYDFFIPTNIPHTLFREKNPTFDGALICGDNGVHISKIVVDPGKRVLIPSGIRVLIEPINSMLQANNKSGIATKSGLIVGATIVDSDYTGEIHLSVINTNATKAVVLTAGDKLVQFIHIPIYTPELEEIPTDLYEEIACHWGDRGDNGFGSTGK